MGTNYYYQTEICPHCKRSEELHIGKSSAGWVFLFQAHEDPEIKSFQDYLNYFEKTPGKIMSEYKEEFSVSQFEEMINRLQSQDLRPRVGDRNWIDYYGYSFSDYNFS